MLRLEAGGPVSESKARKKNKNKNKNSRALLKTPMKRRKEAVKAAIAQVGGGVVVVA
jgi:hypothetical protein